MNSTHFNCLRLNLCQESQNPRILSRECSQPIRNGSDTDRQTDDPLTEGPNPVGVFAFCDLWRRKKNIRIKLTRLDKKRNVRALGMTGNSAY